MTLSHRLRVGASTSPFSFNDAAYSNFFTDGGNSNPIIISNSSNDDFSGTTSNTPNSLQSFIDHSEDKIYTGWEYFSSYSWGNGGNNYSGNANFYQDNGSQVIFNGWYSTPAGYGQMMGITIGYLGDNTAVFILGSSYEKLYFFNYPSGNYIGNQVISYGTTNNPANAGDTEFRSVAFDGTHILAMNSSGGTIYGYDMPASTSAISGNTISTSRKWTSSASGSLFYGMAWGGDGVYIGTSTGAVYDRLSGTGYNGSHTYVSGYNAIGGTGDGVAIDYKNRKLVIGGGFYHNRRVYGE